MHTEQDSRSWRPSLTLHHWGLLLTLVLFLSSQAACRECPSSDQQPQQATENATPPVSSEPPLMLEVYFFEAHRPVLSTDAHAVTRAAQGNIDGLLRDARAMPADTPLGERLAALEEDGALTILASYRFLTRFGEQSWAQAGYQVPIQTNRHPHGQGSRGAGAGRDRGIAAAGARCPR